MNTMKTIYEKVEEKGLRIPLEVCRLADISNEVVIILYRGKIEICSQFIDFKLFLGETKMYFLMTNDVESFSIPLNKLDIETAKEVYEVGLPRLLDLYARHDTAISLAIATIAFPSQRLSLIR
ncbi:MAG: hypothetical protein BA871_16420 [Desulfuromonadales bacterium C00003096]|nr:MAG: hypothetical protein BA871_16420 [Desulfuromonadales bacterium C00003096]